MKRDPARNGWLDLPGGGAVELKDGVPVRVSDKGRWGLDENRILSDAAAQTGVKLTWAYLNRSKRWRYGNFFRSFLPGNAWDWCIASVLRAGCDLCASGAGVKWVPLSGEEVPAWVCEPCSRTAADIQG
jgi:hypothetical protein